MKVTPGKSRDVIDRRRPILIAAGLGLFALIAALLGLGHHEVDPEEQLVSVVSTALDRGQSFWSGRLPGYRHAMVVLFRDRTPTACGTGETAAGPFYCPTDERIYLDLSFLAAIHGDLARAYVIAHELGHHVQHLRGELGAERPSVTVELEADCYAGAWMRAEQLAGDLEVGDVTAALGEASAIGDDRLCPTCSPEQWTHGSASQRVASVDRGIDGGACH